MVGGDFNVRVGRGDEDVSIAAFCAVHQPEVLGYSNVRRERCSGGRILERPKRLPGEIEDVENPGHQSIKPLSQWVAPNPAEVTSDAGLILVPRVG